MKFPEVKIGLLILWMKILISPSIAVDPISTDTSFDSYLSPEWQKYVMDIITKGFTNFTLTLDKTLDQRRVNGNILFSPASITKSLGMTMLASGGQIFQDLVKVLGLDSGLRMSDYSEVVHRLLSLSIEDYERKHKNDPTYPRCTLSSALYYESESLQARQIALLNSKIYQADNTAVPSKLDDSIRQSINFWISNQTEGAISKALESPLDYNSPTIITSATSFYGEWHREFTQTSKKSFYPEPNNPVEVDMMLTLSQIPYYEDTRLGLRMIGIPFKEKEVVMYVILPDGEGSSSLKLVKESLDATVIEDMIARMKPKPRLVLLPRLQLTSNLKLRDSLKAMGLNSLFEKSTRADESLTPSDRRNLSEDERNYLNYIRNEDKTGLGTDGGRRDFNDTSANEFIHAVKMTVDEKGVYGGPNRGSETIELFNVDKPFLFFIRYTPTNSILLWGSIYDPTL